MTSPDNTHGHDLGEHDKQVSLIKELNGLLRGEEYEEGPVYDPKVLQLLEQIKNPIVVDLNGTLITSTRKPQDLHPGAQEAIGQLTSVGTVLFCTTSSRDWESQHERLQNWGLWNDKTVMLTDSNWRFPLIAEPDRVQERYQEFVDFSNIHGREFTIDQLHASGLNKRLAPLFMRTFDIPIIDNEPRNVFKNPGMRGVLVTSFDSFDEREISRNLYDGAIPLLAGAATVVGYYTSGGSR